MKYSKVQYFFWILAGSEISALKECENEYNRHANIGMMILITSVFAFFTAYIAGNTFVHEHSYGVILFATVWALLIFSIDRSMVNSIKRDPDKDDQPFWPFFAPRLVLACILAFFMSIPLDHVVFSEAIERQRRINVHNEWLNRQEELNEGYDISSRESEQKSKEKLIKEIENEVKSGCPLPDYLESMRLYNRCAPAIPPLKNNYERKRSAASSYYSQLPVSAEGKKITDQAYIALTRSRNDAWQTYQDKIKECNNHYDEAKKIESNWRANKQTEISQNRTLYANSQAKLDIDKDNARKNADTFRSDLEEMHGFDTKFTTLFLMPNWGVQVLKWAIFLALLVIEILPTYLKLKTPIGQYDRKMQERERTMINDIAVRVSSEEQIIRETEQHRVAKEIELNKTIIDRVAFIELNLAEELLIEWENRAREQSTKRLDEVNIDISK